MNDEEVLLNLIEDSLRMYTWKGDYSKGNLLINGIDRTPTAVIIGNAYAPYALATNEKWTSPRWNGKQNPNEDWADNVVLQVTRIYASQYGYKVVVS
jgi:hypothetical protein